MTSKPVYWLLGSLVFWAWCAIAQPIPPADHWLTNAVTYPGTGSSESVRSNLFADLRAEVVAEKLVVNWTPDGSAPTGSVVVFASAAPLSHWPTRDWRPYPLSRVESRWQGLIPVEDPDVAVAYFVVATGSQATNCSPMRGVLPGAIGLEEPTRIFWPFLEGFEQGIDSWRTSSKNPSDLQTNSTAHNGYFALSVTVQNANRSTSVSTTRLRGWQIRAEGATGLRIWLRTRTGVGRASCSLLSNAGAAKQSVGAWPNEIVVTDQWRKVELMFSALPRLPLGDVDLFALDFRANGPREFLIDDLQLLGPWKSDLD